MKLPCGVLYFHFGPVSLPRVSKNDDKELCFLKQFGFSKIIHIWTPHPEYNKAKLYLLCIVMFKPVVSIKIYKFLE